MIYTGVIESRMDPLKLGRCQVRVHELHTYDKTILPTSDLPWAYPLQAIDSAAISGIGRSPTGAVEGTVVLIVFRDEEKQQPIMIGTIGGIPQGAGIVDSEKPPLFLNEEGETESIPVTTSDGGSVVTSAGAPVITQSPVTTLGIPGNSPYTTRSGSSVKIDGNSVAGIQALGKAMDKLGITGSYARASILGIVGGECGWVPQKENFIYSKNRIKEVFSWISDEDADRYANWKGSREDFFRFIYSPSTRSGKNLGNKELDDGALYYGRGLIQLTGAFNYKKYAKLTSIDIVNSPEQLDDIDKSAIIAVAYFKDRVKKQENDPGYFDAACAAVGFNVPNIKAKKEAFYNYFLLGDPVASLNPQQVSQSAEIGSQPDNVEVAANGLPADRQQSIVLGFRDPNMKYPLRDFLNESDVNRLARGKTDGTSVQTRDNIRVTGVKTADDDSWSQPPIPYNSRYPFNRVYASESGHIQEFDDTPNNERINTMHRSGTFTEIDVNGTQVNRIIGDGYQILDRNGFIYVKGAYSITSEGNTTIFVNADAHIKVAGQAVMDFQQDLDINVAGDFNLSVGGDFKNSTAGSITELAAVDKIGSVGGTETLKIGGNYTVEVANAYSKVAASIAIGSNSGATTIASNGVLHLKASGTYAVDASRIDMNSGASSASVPSIGSIPNTPILSIPTLGQPANNSFPILSSPPRNFEIDTSFETPEEISTDDGTVFHKKRDNNIVGPKSEPTNTPAETSIIVPPNTVQTTGSNCDIIMNMVDFPMSLKLSANFTLGNLIADPKHILTDQYLQDNRTSPARKYTKQEIVCNLKGVAENILEPIVALVPGGKSAFTITSGYRFAGLTANESKVSDHPKGNAVDIVLTGKSFDYKAHYDLCVMLAAKLPFHQFILEYRDAGKRGNSRGQRIVWIHIAHRYVGSSKSAFTMLNDKTYGQGFALLEA